MNDVPLKALAMWLLKVVTEDHVILGEELWEVVQKSLRIKSLYSQTVRQSFQKIGKKWEQQEQQQMNNKIS